MRSVLERFAGLALLTTGALALTGCGGGGTAQEVAISPEWLSAHLEDPWVVVLQVGTDSASYATEHIPGARFLDVKQIAVSRGGLTNQVPSIARLRTAYGGEGVSDSSRVVVYGAPLAAARAFVTLDVLGLGGRTALLDGGERVWREEGRGLSGGTQASATSAGSGGSPGSVGGKAQPGRVVDAAWVEEHRTHPGVVLLDARGADQYSGQVAGEGVPRPGHIPGAHDLDWHRTIVSLDRPRLKDAGTLRALFRGAGAEPGDTIVAYCRTGMEASFLYYVARYLGYTARLYDGSFLDWSRHPDLPVER